MFLEDMSIICLRVTSGLLIPKNEHHSTPSEHILTITSLFLIFEISNWFWSATIHQFLSAYHYMLAISASKFFAWLRCNLKFRYSQIWLWWRILVQEADARPPESNMNNLPFEVDAKLSKIYLHKTTDLWYEPSSHDIHQIRS